MSDQADPRSNGPENDEVELGGSLADHPLTAARLEALKRLEAAGVDPYPVGFHRSHTAAMVADEHPGLEPGSETQDRVTVAGRVRLVRTFGKLLFVTIQDGTGRLQLMATSDRSDADVFERVSELDVGDIVGASGLVITTRRGELSVLVDECTVLAKGLRPLPEKWKGLQDVEARSRRRYLDLISNDDSLEVARTRSAVVSELRRQFERRGYIEVETPVLLNQAGGALARPFVTNHHALDLEMYLRIATELPLKMLVVGGLERVFEIGRIFRNEGIDATHNPEFTMLESYEAYADYRDIASMVEEILAAVAEAVCGSTRFTYRGREVDLTPPFRRARMVDMVADAVGRPVWPSDAEALGELCRTHGIATEATDGPGRMIERLFDALVEDSIWNPVFVLDHPVETSPLARRHRDDRQLTERFELFMAGSEYANAYSELNDPFDQRARFEQQAQLRSAGDDEAHAVDEVYLEAMEYGMPPMGGLGIGVDRLVMLLTDRSHIREVILFPTMRP